MKLKLSIHAFLTTWCPTLLILGLLPQAYGDPALANFESYLKASNSGVGPSDSSNMSSDQFGFSAAISGNTLVIGAPGEDSASTGVNGSQGDELSDAGAAYVFVRDGDTWTQQAYLKASDTSVGDFAGDRFGTSVAIDGDTIVVGAPLEDSIDIHDSGNNEDYAVGAAYVFTRVGTTWSQIAYLKATPLDGTDFFGVRLAIQGDTIAVSAWNHYGPDNDLPDSGAVYVFSRAGGTWTQQAYLRASNAGEGDSFGASVALDGDTLAIGATGESSAGLVAGEGDNSVHRSGAAYIFVREGGGWTQQAYLKASNPNAIDRFGNSIGLSGDTVVVGAFGEDSLSTGVNDSQTNDVTNGNTGAAYVFTRQGTTWTQEAYLKASNTDRADQFGYSVAIQGSTILVGANTEDSAATGVNGDETSNAVSGAGSAYLFHRNSGNWEQVGYLKASNTGTFDSGGDQFGYTVALDGCSAVIGAPLEDSAATGVNSDGSNNGARGSGAAYVFQIPLASDITLETYAEWAARYAIPIDQAGPSDDPNNDGIPNIIAYASGLGPVGASQKSPFDTEATAPGLVIGFISPKSVTGLIISSQINDDLQGWEPGPTPIVTPVSATEDRVSITILTSGLTRGFAQFVFAQETDVAP